MPEQRLEMWPLGDNEKEGRLLFECLGDAALFYLDPAGRVITWSANAAHLLGYGELEILGQPNSRLFTPDEVQAGEPEKELRTAVQTGRVSDDHWQGKKDGTRFWARSVTIALQDEQGQLRGFAKVIRDRTEQKEAEGRKDEWLAMLAHELRGPLNPMSNAVAVLLLRARDDPQLRGATDIIARQTRHLVHIVEDLLEASRLARGLVNLRRERLDLSSLVRTTAEDYRPALEQAGLTLSVETPETPICVSADGTRLTQVLGNLLNNAAKFTGPGGTITIHLHQNVDRRQACLIVQDTGAGIETGMLNHLFDTFAQADRSLDRAGGGLGLGLAMVKGLVELHGGEVQATSAGQGHGAEFTFTLPLEKEPAALLDSVRGPIPSSRPHRILVIEDNRDAAESLRLLLDLLGHEVRVAYTGPEGVQAAVEWIPEVIISDIGLPRLDGYGVARAIRQHPALARTKLIAVTGYGREEDRSRARESGFDYVLTKPAEPAVLLELLDEDK
jgi:PAS domain S-box-containing protein